MPVELGGAFLSAFLQVLFERIASREVIDFFKGRKLNDVLLEKLRITLNSIDGLLDDAEGKQITQEAVKRWLDDLKDAVYEADDLLDEIAYKAQQSQLKPAKHKVRNFFSSRNPFKKGIEGKLEDILERLEYLVKQNDILGLKKGGEKTASQKTPTTSLVDESDVYGRNNDKEVLIKFLLSDGDGLGVTSIVGMAGIGKTTLAQLVYNDSRVQEHFELRAWVCVSEEFDVSKLTKDILEEFTQKTPQVETLNHLQLELKQKVAERRFLLVLDDVWNDKRTEWISLKGPLKSGHQGSRVVVTTRHEKVATVVSTVPIHHLKELSVDECWSLFAKCAFHDGNSSIDPVLVRIGKEVVAKCKGLPLAAKVLGGLLHSKTDVNEWERVLTSNLWDLSKDDILPALKLSYYYLPSHLKRCFAYCSILPKDYEFQKEELVLLWMAEGFLVEPEGDKAMEEVGNEYFLDLVSRSLFQPSSGSQSCFIMHDLIHELAKFVSGEFCFRLEDVDLRKIPKRIRHLSHLSEGYYGDKKFVGIYKTQPLRTLLIYTRWLSTSIDDEVTHDMLPSLKRLRVLYLSKHLYVTELPKSIDKLKHLRYLNLLGASIKRLPESVTSLYNLQTIILHQCRSLVELPASTESLINLGYLDIRGTNLQGMPPKMGKLTKLQKLTDFVVGKQSGSGIEELGNLDHIRGDLSIQNLQNIANSQDALAANLLDKKHLKKLKFKWTGEINSSEHAMTVLKHLEPNVNIHCLHIIGYRSERFPDWVGDSSFSNLKSLKLIGCKNCSCLPPLGQLAALEDLSIVEFDKIISVGPEFYGTRAHMKKPFASLEVLRFERMPKWHHWKDEAGAFPLLRALHIRECPDLTKSLPSELPCLTTLEIQGCQQLKASLPRAPTVYEMSIRDASRRAMLVKLSSGIYQLEVDRFHFVDSPLEVVEHMDGLSTSLEDIQISNHDSLECFPLESFPELRRLNINACANLRSLSSLKADSRNILPSSSSSFLKERIPAPDPYSKAPCLWRSSSSFRIQELCIIDCQQLLVVSIPVAPTITRMILTDESRDLRLEVLPSGMHRLRVEKFHSLEDIELWLTSIGFTTLEEIVIKDCVPIKCFQLELYPKLKRLDISSCRNLKSFSASESTVGEFPSLISFELEDCPELASFPKGSFCAPNLSKLRLSKCSNLELLPDRLCSTLSSLDSLEIDRCPELESFPNGGLPSNLKSLDIVGCNKLKLSASDYEVVGTFLKLPCTLIHLRISGLQCQKALRYGKLKLLKEMEIWNCPNLHYIPECALLPSLAKLEVVNCPQLESFLKGRLPSHLESIVIRDCKKVIAGLMQLDLRMLSHLMNFVIAGYDDVDSLPEETLLPSSLTSLEIFDFKNLKSLELQHLTSLKHLGIYNCDNLKCIPKEGLSSSLSSLFIFDCAILSKRCRRELGEDWPKIAHIRNLLILPMD